MAKVEHTSDARVLVGIDISKHRHEVLAAVTRAWWQDSRRASPPLRRSRPCNPTASRGRT